MKRRSILGVIGFAWVLLSCAPLNPQNSTVGDIGEVTWRVLLCPLTLCLSEVELKRQKQDAAQRAAYQSWYHGLSSEQQDREDRREEARLFGLGLALSGGGPFRNFSAPPAQVYQSVPVPITPLRRPTLCTTDVMGSSAYTTCQ